MRRTDRDVLAREAPLDSTRASRLETYLIVDCGSTTTKAILIAPREGSLRLAARAEAPTTVEDPVADVVIGVSQAVRALSAVSGCQFWDDRRHAVRMARGAEAGADHFLSTSSAGGGLQMLVMGVVGQITGASATRAALGAGAIVTDVLAFDDRRSLTEQISLLQSLRPDMILLSGGVDGGAVDQVLQLAELLATAAPQPRLPDAGRLPVIFAGNRAARLQVEAVLSENFTLVEVENIRPSLERENPAPAREAIQAVFLEHVMARAPGYARLQQMCTAPLLPTPAAVGQMIRTLADPQGETLVAVDIGGATTDVFSAGRTGWRRTVSANLGLSYSLGNIRREAGLARIARWLPFPCSDEVLCDQILNKMARPTTLPYTLQNLLLEHAAAREALAGAFAQHLQAAMPLRGIRRSQDIGDTFDQAQPEKIIAPQSIGRLIGSGGAISHAPRRQQAALILIDALQPTGLTELSIDSVFMLPHLGVLATIAAEEAREVLYRDCLLPLGACVAPLALDPREGRRIADFRLQTPGCADVSGALRAGELIRLSLPAATRGDLRLQPCRGVDFGEGKGRPVRWPVPGGEVGLILDGRGRPLRLPSDPALRRTKLQDWARAMNAYPEGSW